MSDRYEGKLFLRLLDSYVLDAIGHLDEANAKWLVESEPYFRATLEATGSWQEIVEQRMQFPPEMQSALKEMWEKGQERFRQESGTDPDPVMFTHTFVDTRFPY